VSQRFFNICPVTQLQPTIWLASSNCMQDTTRWGCYIMLVGEFLKNFLLHYYTMHRHISCMLMRSLGQYLNYKNLRIGRCSFSLCRNFHFFFKIVVMYIFVSVTNTLLKFPPCSWWIKWQT